jgi:hypothetical protein
MMPNYTQPPEKRSSLQTIAIVCTKLEQGVSEEEIRKFLDRDNEYASDFLKFYIEFALENSWLIKDESGKYKITKYGNEFISVFLPTDST